MLLLLVVEKKVVVRRANAVASNRTADIKGLLLLVVSFGEMVFFVWDERRGENTKDSLEEL